MGSDLMTSPMITPVQLAERLNISTLQLAQWRHRGIGPSFVKAGRLVRYQAADVEKWITAQTTQLGEQLHA